MHREGCRDPNFMETQLSPGISSQTHEDALHFIVCCTEVVVQCAAEGIGDKVDERIIHAL